MNTAKLFSVSGFPGPAVLEAIQRHNQKHDPEAVRRVAGFLRCLGLPAHSAEDMARTLLEDCASRDGIADDDIVPVVLDEVSSRFDAWLESLRKTKGEGADCQLGLLAWHLRPVLAACPGAFLGRAVLPDSVRLAVAASAQPALPEPLSESMPSHPLGELPEILRGGFWRRVAERWISLRGSVRAWMAKR